MEVRNMTFKVTTQEVGGLILKRLRPFLHQK